MINFWHSLLNMPKHDLAWHKQDLADELAEYEEAEGLIDKWSELSDLVYTYTRARWSGHQDIDRPFGPLKFAVGFIYMIPKYSLRWSFFRTVGKNLNQELKITEVRNPKKVEKLETIAKKYNLDPVLFTTEAKRLMKYWIFLK